MMRSYAETLDCSRGFVLNYVGEEFDAPCDNCDNCEAGTVTDGRDIEAPFELNARVRHPTLGDGMVVRYENDKIVVLFDEAGYKTLSLELVEYDNLLREAT